MQFALTVALLGTGAVAQMSSMLAILNKLDNSAQGKCHQISVFTMAVNTINDPTISAAITGGNLMKQMMAQAAVGVINNKLSPLTGDQAVMAACQPTIPVDNMVIDCLTMQGMGKLNALLNNQTMLDMVTKGDATKVDQLKKIQAAFQPKVDAVNNNATESDYCKTSVDSRCIQQTVMTKFISLGQDQNALNAHFNNNATLVDLFKTFSAKAQTRLDAMKNDQALSAVCGKMPNISPIDINAITLDDLPTTLPAGYNPQMAMGQM